MDFHGNYNPYYDPYDDFDAAIHYSCDDHDYELGAWQNSSLSDDYSDDTYAEDDDESHNKIIRTIHSHASNMLFFLYDCFKKEIYYDVVVTVGNRVFKAHRFVLAMVSEYFRALLL